VRLTRTRTSLPRLARKRSATGPTGITSSGSSSPKSRVDGTNLVLSPCAAQLPDGSIDTEITVTTDPPHVNIYELVDGDTRERRRVNLKDARKVAQALLEAVDEVDRAASDNQQDPTGGPSSFGGGPILGRLRTLQCAVHRPVRAAQCGHSIDSKR
jgi:hypothetical protein